MNPQFEMVFRFSTDEVLVVQVFVFTVQPKCFSFSVLRNTASRRRQGVRGLSVRSNNKQLFEANDLGCDLGCDLGWGPS